MRPTPTSHALALVAALLVGAPVAAGQWYQVAGDAARTGAADDEGPEWPDVAWVVELPTGADSYPIVVGRDAYVIANGTIVRVGLDDPVPQIVATIPFGAAPLASDGARLFVVTNRSVTAYGLGGATIWDAPHAQFVASGGTANCAAPAHRDGILVVLCVAWVSSAQGLADIGAAGLSTVVRALDARSGASLWSWTNRAGCPLPPPPPPLPPPPTCTEAGPADSFDSWLAALNVAVDGEHVVALVEFAGGGIVPWPSDVVVLDRATGAEAWRAPLYGPDPSRPATSAGAAPPTLSGGRVYVADASTIAFDAATGERLWAKPLRGQPTVTNWQRASGFRDGVFYATSETTVFAIDVETQAERWTYQLGSERWWGRSILTSTRAVYAPAFTLDDTAFALRALDPETGREVWRHHLQSKTAGGGNVWHFAASGGVIIGAGVDGQIVALGRTATSMTPRPEASSEYPAVGEIVRVDLSTSGAGRGGAPVAFRASWGDGTQTEWQESPTLDHAYAEAGVHEARMHVRNAANETASVALTFHVGGHPPTFLETAFAAENQNASFFVIGLVLTAVGAAFGLVRGGRRRSRFARERRVLEEAYVRSGVPPIERERAIRAQQARIHDLLLTRKLDEPQVALLDRRAVEMLSALRLASVDERLHFLPHGMVLSLQEILADGRVTAWERHHFLDALERDRLLLPEQKAQVRALIDEWFARDKPDQGA